MRHLSASGIAFLIALGSAACTVQTVPVKGDKGDNGIDGNPGIPDVQAIAGLQSAVESLQMKVNALESKADALQSKVDALEAPSDDPDCPAGYMKAAKPFVPANLGTVLCTKGDDEVVKVGAGGAAFWIDRYEASVWEGDSMQRFANGDDSNLGSTFMKNGQSSIPWMAKSVSDVTPARYITWFQAQAACRAGGKRLPSGEEWLAAARGTGDPGANDGFQNTKCSTSAPGPRQTGKAGDPASTPQAIGCFSDWGAEDMIGNEWEVTAEWYASIDHLGLMYNNMPVSEPNTDQNMAWPDAAYNDDSTWGILSSVSNGGGVAIGPSKVLRGGNHAVGQQGGLFAMYLYVGPSHSSGDVGFRCLLPK